MQKIFYFNLQITTNSIQIPYNIIQNLYKKHIASFYRVEERDRHIRELNVQLEKLIGVVELKKN